ncbi:MAG: ABC transporter ATP-binding protein [Phycisphaerae bacterium]|nr:ABC transporter ATP-binding protein [Phycisphaerae bacterium]
MSRTASLLELIDVHKRYTADGPAVLRGLSLRLDAGERLTVTGPSGSGKSTLLNLIAALDAPTSGRVRLDGTDLATCSETHLATLRNKRIGMVFQLHHLLPQCTVWENVLVPALAAGGPSAETEDHARRLLDRVGLGDHAPGGSRAGDRPGRLSGGQRQRVAVVRALVNAPALLLADEPTGSLDRRTADELAGLLCELNAEQGVALIVATHSRRLAGQIGSVRPLREGALGEGAPQTDTPPKDDPDEPTP